jgi:hypothetical protein
MFGHRGSTSIKAMVLILTGALWFATPTLAQAPLDGADLLARIKAFEAFKPADAFSRGYDQAALVGQSFRIEAPVQRLGSAPVDDIRAIWTYDADTPAMTLEVFSTRWFPHLWTAGPKSSAGQAGMLTGYELASTTTPQGGYVGTNAFGAKVTVKKSAQKSYGLAFVDQPAQTPFASFSGFTAKLALSPDEARALSTDLKVVLEGALASGPHGAAACGYRHRAPEIDSPEDRTEEFCLFFARLDRVAFTASDGRVLAEWRRAGRPAASAPAVMRPAAAGAGFAVQIGTFSSEALANEALRRRLAGSGATGVAVEPASAGGQLLYRALLTGFPGNAQAQAACERLREAGAACIVRSR